MSNIDPTHHSPPTFVLVDSPPRDSILRPLLERSPRTAYQLMRQSCRKNIGLGQFHTRDGRVFRNLSKHEARKSRIQKCARSGVCYRCDYFAIPHYIRPPKTTFPRPANSAFAPFLLASSKSLTTPATITFRSLASALANISPVPGAIAAGEGIKFIARV